MNRIRRTALFAFIVLLKLSVSAKDAGSIRPPRKQAAHRLGLSAGRLKNQATFYSLPSNDIFRSNATSFCINTTSGAQGEHLSRESDLINYYLLLNMMKPENWVTPGKVLGACNSPWFDTSNCVDKNPYAGLNYYLLQMDCDDSFFVMAEKQKLKKIVRAERFKVYLGPAWDFATHQTKNMNC